MKRYTKEVNIQFARYNKGSARVRGIFEIETYDGKVHITDHKTLFLELPVERIFYPFSGVMFYEQPGFSLDCVVLDENMEQLQGTEVADALTK